MTFQPLRCSDCAVDNWADGWVDTMAARQLYEAAVTMKAAAGDVHEALVSAVYRHCGWAEGANTQYFLSAREIAADAVRLDPVQPATCSFLQN
jgi:hypothetical protein